MTRGTVPGCAVVAALASLLSAGGASGDLLAAWNFNGLATPVAGAIGAAHGSGTLDLAAFGGSGLSWQSGTDLNAWPGDAAGEGLGFTGTGANGKSAVVSIGTVGYTGLTLSLAMRATSTGHLSSVLEAQHGANWETVGGFTLTPGTWSVATFDLGSLDFLENGTASLRLRLEGASSAQGNLRIDNLLMEGTPVPAPGACLLLAAAVARGRRRRN